MSCPCRIGQRRATHHTARHTLRHTPSHTARHSATAHFDREALPSSCRREDGVLVPLRGRRRRGTFRSNAQTRCHPCLLYLLAGVHRNFSVQLSLGWLVKARPSPLTISSTPTATGATRRGRGRGGQRGCMRRNRRCYDWIRMAPASRLCRFSSLNAYPGQQVVNLGIDVSFLACLPHIGGTWHALAHVYGPASLTEPCRHGRLQQGRSTPFAAAPFRASAGGYLHNRCIGW